MVNLNLGRILSQKGHDVSLVGLDLSQEDLSKVIAGPAFSSSTLSVGEPKESPDVRIRQIWPPIWVRRRREERLVVIQPWEFGSVPVSWLEGIENVDAIWVPSEYCKRGYMQSGVDPKKVWVIPNGFDCDQPMPIQRLKREKTNLLYLGGTIFRKGIDVLVGSLDLLDDARIAKLDLVVKDVGGQSFYSNQSLLADALAAHPRVRARTRVENRHLKRDQLLRLIAESDVLVHPYRSEGFGMPVLEAMAAGTPVIHTQGGATNEFCSSDESLLIPSSLKVADEPRVGELLLADQCYWYEPSMGQLAQLIGDFVDGRTEVQPLVEAARRRARQYSWESVGGIAEDALCALSGVGEPVDSLSDLVTDLSNFLESDGAGSAPLLSKLVAIGDLRTASLLSTHLENRTDIRDGVEIASVREQLSSVAMNTPDVWSGGQYRALVCEAEFEKTGQFGYVHDFEGGDQATYAIAQYLSGYLSGCRSVLDLACGQGSMLRVLRGQGKAVQGVEADPALVKELRADGFKVFQGYVPSDLNDFDIVGFDGVFLGHIVEHLEPSDFEKVLDWIFEKISDNGTVLIQTPDFANSSVVSENFWLDASHIRPYPIRLLKAMLSESGFVPIEGGCRRIPEVAPLDAIALGRRLPRKDRTSIFESEPLRTSLKIGHYALFNGESGFSQASRSLFNVAKLLSDGMEVIEISVDQTARGATSPTLRPTVPLRFSERARSDIAVIDVPVGWLGEVSSRVRAKYRIARTTFEAMPLAMSFRSAARAFDEVWCFSHYDAEILANSGISGGSIISMPPGIALPDPKQVQIRRNGVKRGLFRFLSVFHFEPRKNPEALVRAFCNVVEEVPQCELVLKVNGVTVEEFAGWLTALLGYAKADDISRQIHLLAGNVSRETLQGLYLESDVYVLPSRGEGYGLPFLEALAHGLPTICPDVGGHREFCSVSNSLLVKTTLVPASTTPGVGVFRESFWREVDLDDLVSKMLEAVNKPEILAKLSEKGISDASRFGIHAYQTASANRLREVAADL